MDKSGLCHAFRRLEGHCEIGAMAECLKETAMKMKAVKETR